MSPATIRRCGDDEREAILGIVNAAAEAYRGVIPADRWHEPYMSSDELAARSMRASSSGATRTRASSSG